jgi:hypothetical protein
MDRSNRCLVRNVHPRIWTDVKWRQLQHSCALRRQKDLERENSKKRSGGTSETHTQKGNV